MSISARDPRERPRRPLPEGPAAKQAEIRRLYYETRPGTVASDLERAIAILTSMATEEERERAAVYMDGLSQMRAEWSGGVEPARDSTRRRAKGRAAR